MSPATPPRPEVLQQRYAAIEQVYAEQNWPEVEARCQSLLAELPDQPGDPLRQRLLLLLAHTQLYGSGDPAAAASLYRAVLNAEPEAVLAEIARQGLVHCGLPDARQDHDQRKVLSSDPIADVETLAAAAAAALEVSAEATASWPGGPVAEQPAKGPAMPWLQELGGEMARSRPPEEGNVVLAPFQMPKPQSEQGSTPEEPAPPKNAAKRSAATQSVKPLRWPFMADYVEPPSTMRPSEEAIQKANLDDAKLAESEAQPNPSEKEAAVVIRAPEPLGMHMHATKSAAASLIRPESSGEILNIDVFSAEEILELSQGLLRVTLISNHPKIQGQAKQT